MQEMSQAMDLHRRNLPRRHNPGLRTKMSIQAMAEEISNQTRDLPRFASWLRETRVPKFNPSSLIFAGSGDSYAAAVFAEELSHGKSLASDPYELLTNIGRARGKNLAIVSISGRTRTNIKLAKKAKNVAVKRIAVTANPESPLARECDDTLQLRYRAPGILTSGTISFTTSLLACGALLRNVPSTVRLESALSAAKVWARELKLTKEGSLVFVGSGVDFALALYGAAKIHEVLGTRAEAVYPEQLGHAKLFTIDKKRDHVVCISSGRDKAKDTHQLLIKHGFRSSIMAFPDSHVVNRSLKIAIYLQRLAVSLARKKGIKECAFLSDKSRLNLSNRMIY